MGFKKKIRSKNLMIDKRIDRQGKMVDKEIKGFMVKKKRTVLLDMKKKKGKTKTAKVNKVVELTEREFDVGILFTKEDLPIPKILELRDKIYSSIKLRRRFEKLVSESIEESSNILKLSGRISKDTTSTPASAIASAIIWPL